VSIESFVPDPYPQSRDALEIAEWQMRQLQRLADTIQQIVEKLDELEDG